MATAFILWIIIKINTFADIRVTNLTIKLRIFNDLQRFKNISPIYLVCSKSNLKLFLRTFSIFRLFKCTYNYLWNYLISWGNAEIFQKSNTKIWVTIVSVCRRWTQFVSLFVFEYMCKMMWKLSFKKWHYAIYNTLSISKVIVK